MLTDEYTEKPTFSKQKLDWEEDVQLSSKYQDRKVCNSIPTRHHNSIKLSLLHKNMMEVACHVEYN